MSGFLQQHQDFYQQPEETQATTDKQYQNHHEHWTRHSSRDARNTRDFSKGRDALGDSRDCSPSETAGSSVAASTTGTSKTTRAATTPGTAESCRANVKYATVSAED
jgi:hypothetical protein